MPSQKTTGILLGGALLVLVAVGLVLNGLADGISSLLYKAGLSAQYAADVHSVVFFGGFFLLIVLLIKALPRFSRV
jgi:hypothetical protein